MLKLLTAIKKIVLSKFVLRLALFAAASFAVTVCFGELEKFIVVDGGNTYHVTAYANDATDILNIAGVTLDSEDIVETEIDGDKTYITVDRFFIQNEVNSLVDKFSDLTADVNASVNDAFTNANVESKDKIEYVYKTVKTTLTFERKTVYDGKIKRGKSSTVKGKNGEKETVYVTKFVNGIEMETTVHSEKITKKPVDQVTTIGTYYNIKNPVEVMTSEDIDMISELTPSSPIPLDANGHPVNYSNILYGKGTAYCKGTICSTGVKAKPGYVAVDPREIPYGTKLFIVSADGKYVYGYAIAADTGGFAKNPNSNIVCDLRMNEYNDCINFGRRDIIIYVIG